MFRLIHGNSPSPIGCCVIGISGISSEKKKIKKFTNSAIPQEYSISWRCPMVQLRERESKTTCAPSYIPWPLFPSSSHNNANLRVTIQSQSARPFNIKKWCSTVLLFLWTIHAPKNLKFSLPYQNLHLYESDVYIALVCFTHDWFQKNQVNILTCLYLTPLLNLHATRHPVPYPFNTVHKKFFFSTKIAIWKCILIKDAVCAYVMLPKTC